MFVWVFEPWNQDVVLQHQVPESSGPPLTMYKEKFHSPHGVIKFS